MAKQLFEFTDEEVAQLLWNKLVNEGKASRDGMGSLSAKRRGWKEKGFDVTLKIEDEK